MATVSNSQDAAALPLSQDIDVYISTQVQSRYDDFEAEQESLKLAKKLRQQFTHTHTRSDVSEERESTTAVRRGKRSRPDQIDEAARAKRARKPSTTSEQLMKLSGRPEKVKKMRKYNPKLKPLSEVLSGKGSLKEEVKVFSGKEWSKVSTTLTTHLKRVKNCVVSDGATDDTPWWLGNDEPSELEIAELNMLYKETENPTADLYEPPITLSQVVKPIYQSPPPPEVIEISDYSEVECSEEEGDLILLDSHPISISSEPSVRQQSQDKSHSPTTISRVTVRTEASSQIETVLSEVLSTQVLYEPALSDDEVNDSLDEDFVTRTILIKRKGRFI